MIGTLLTLLVLGVLGIAALGVVFALVGAVIGLTLGLVSLLLFKVAPVLLVGWVVVKLVQRSRARPQISARDQKWLDS